MWVDCGDRVRVIGRFSAKNKYTLSLGDAESQDVKFVIVEPHILIPTTQIVKTNPCIRRALLTNQYRNPEINYALVLGNVVHEIF